MRVAVESGGKLMSKDEEEERKILKDPIQRTIFS